MPAVSRKPASGKTVVQTVILPGSWLRENAASWLKSHGYKSDTLTKEGQNWRARQYNPGDFDPKSFHTVSAGQVKLVRARAK